MVTAHALRPAWTPLTILLMVLGFIFFWPLGFAMLAYILWGDRIPEIKRHFEGMVAPQSDGKSDRKYEFFRDFGGKTQSGNAAFDGYRDRELKRLEEERRRLDDELREFESFMRDLRRARDQEEFDRFMRDRSNRTARNDDTTIDL